jgi:hypothetical protein
MIGGSNMPSFCWRCGKKLVQATAGKYVGTTISVARRYHGATITMHKSCAARHDREQKEEKHDWLKNRKSEYNEEWGNDEDAND